MEGASGYSGATTHQRGLHVVPRGLTEATCVCDVMDMCYCGWLLCVYTITYQLGFHCQPAAKCPWSGSHQTLNAVLTALLQCHGQCAAARVEGICMGGKQGIHDIVAVMVRSGHECLSQNRCRIFTCGNQRDHLCGGKHVVGAGQKMISSSKKSVAFFRYLVDGISPSCCCQLIRQMHCGFGVVFCGDHAVYRDAWPIQCWSNNTHSTLCPWVHVGNTHTMHILCVFVIYSVVFLRNVFLWLCDRTKTTPCMRACGCRFSTSTSCMHMCMAPAH